MRNHAGVVVNKLSYPAHGIRRKRMCSTSPLAPCWSWRECAFHIFEEPLHPKPQYRGEDQRVLIPLFFHKYLGSR